MTVAERQEIFAKEYLSNEDLQKLFNLHPSEASRYMNAIKKKLTIGKSKELRLDIRGKLHVQDYLDYLGVTSDRYAPCAQLDEVGACV